ncbi:unnamed protein product [Rotaria sp. Silwood1]|nr:unnamed protein product [Rotaria sp. Silwood1]CAF3388696.1 unnamed protein product [Rotaria sp. Silwood1]CAF3413174.1 unnamed protein product [Rotaria sp. Silwood1]CAF3424938.1 unnamed protein product [Rotaria sp. Silwood1]CAF4612685.1 unnamed protein product [Rotaria sp. Silwood1]
MSLESNVTNLKCVITACRRPANVLCYCCKENLCRNHYNEHDYLNSKLNLLVDEIDTFDKQLLAIDLKKYIQTSTDKLQQWRFDSYKTIDHYCDQKYREIEQYIMKIINQKRENVEQLRTNIVELMQKHRMTLELIESLTLNLRTIENEMNDIDQKHLSLRTSPLILDRDLIHIDELSIEEFDLSSLSAAYKTIDYTRQGLYPIASNNQYLLIHREPNLCLIDRNFKIIKQTIWGHGQIFDMCWSSALEKFFLITLNQIYIFDINTISIDRVEATQKLRWLSCTCSDASLFLSTNENGSSICEFNLLNSLQAAKRWETPDTCSRDERIHDMVFNKGTLFLVIENSLTDKIRVELRSSARLDRLWSLQLDIGYQTKKISCCLLNYDQWLITDSNTSRLFQITMDGKLKSTCYYNPTPCSACRFGFDLLAISTLHGVDIHKI